MIQLDFRSGVPICDQIVNGVIRLKAVGAFRSDDRMPTVRALASTLSVNPNTVQKAYTLLENSGIIYSVKGKGSFISGDDRAHNAVLDAARENFEAAVRKAKELGLDKEQLIKIAERVCGEEQL